MKILDGPFLTNDGVGWLVLDSGALVLRHTDPERCARHASRPKVGEWRWAPEVVGMMLGATALGVMALAMCPWIGGAQ